MYIIIESEPTLSIGAHPIWWGGDPAEGSRIVHGWSGAGRWRELTARELECVRDGVAPASPGATAQVIGVYATGPHDTPEYLLWVLG